MSWQTVRLADAPPTPWRNGGGVTRELLAWPRAPDWRLRISVAEIAADGPFSAYPGVERWFAVLDGGAVALQVDEEAHRLDPASAPLRFDGAATVACRLVDGPTRDFNVMAPPGHAALRRLAGAQSLQVTSPALVALYVHTGHATVAAGPQLPPETLAWRVFDGPATARVEATGCLWMEYRL